MIETGSPASIFVIPRTEERDGYENECFTHYVQGMFHRWMSGRHRIFGLFLARQAVASGTVECALAVGFEQMKPGALKRVWDDRLAPMFRFDDLMTEILGVHDAPRTAQMFYRNHVDNAVARPSSVPGGQIWSAAASTEAGA